MAGHALPNSQSSSRRASAFPGEMGPSHPMRGEVWELRCPVPWVTELAKGHNAGDTLSSNSSRWLHGGELCGSVGGKSGCLGSSHLQRSGNGISLRCPGSGRWEE